ncbi:MAG: nucleotidyl transferase AbiEii/AbiGii toxin family protein [Thermoanaerobaculia bacterium]
MLPTARELHQLCAESGFAVAAVEKVIRLAELLSDIGELEDVGRALALKGGTALNLFLGPPSRLSVDLDFNFVGAEDREEMLAMRPAIEHRLTALARSQGFGVQLSAESHGGRKLFLSYARLADGQSDRIEVDVNYLHRVCLLPTERRKMWRPDGDGPWTNLMSWSEIAASKLVAFLDRAAPRDAWDVPRLVSHAPQAWPPPDLRGLFVALAGTLPRPLHEYGSKSLDRIRDTDVSRLLWPMLIGGERPSAASLREESWSVLAPLLELTPAEMEFCDRLQKGDFHPELLTFDDPGIPDRLRRHPALLWKAENARVHSRRGRHE